MELIDRTQLPRIVTHCAETEHDIGFEEGQQSIIEAIDDAPTIDAVPVDVIEKWLYMIAINNVGDTLCEDCEEIIRRLNGLRKFYAEWKDGDSDVRTKID